MNITLEALFTIGIAVFLLAAFLPLAFRKVFMDFGLPTRLSRMNIGMRSMREEER